MEIGEAVKTLKAGGRVCRSGWNGKNMWLEYEVPNANGRMTVPYVSMKTADNHRVPWLCSQTDLLADDWIIFTLTTI